MKLSPRADARTIAAARQRDATTREEAETARQAKLRDEIGKRVGSRIRQLRLASRWSQEVLAARLGMDRSYLWRSESGTSPVMPQQLYELSRMAQVSVDWFFSAFAGIGYAFREVPAQDRPSLIDVLVLP